MNSRITRSLFVPGIFVVALGLGACDQPETQCFSALSSGSPYTVKYTLVKGTGECAKLKAEPVGVQTYVTNPSKKTDGKNSVALKSMRFGVWILNGQSNRVDPADASDDEANLDPIEATGTLYGVGKFSTKFPNSKDICTAPTLSAATFKMAEVPAHLVGDDEVSWIASDEDEPAKGEDSPPPDLIPVQPALNVTYKWSNFKSYVTAADAGTQFGADLEYTLPGCTATYKAVGINIYTECETDADCSKDALWEQGIGVSDNYAKLSCVETNDPVAIDPQNPPATPEFKKLCAFKSAFPALK